MSRFYNPVAVYWGPAGAKQLAEATKGPDLQTVQVLTWNMSVLEEESVQNLLDRLAAEAYEPIIYQKANPDLSDLLAIHANGSYRSPDLLIAIGGGSVQDLAKCLVTFAGFPVQDVDALRTLIVQEGYKSQRRKTQLLMIPTTAGTGSEVTPWATVWDPKEQRKYSVSDESLFPDYALLLPELTEALPMRTTIATTLDALSHATEAYWSKASNRISRVFALEAVHGLVQALSNPADVIQSARMRKELSFCSLLAGLAFSNTRTTACHSISYPLVMRLGMEHGIAVSLTLGHVFAVNAPAIPECGALLQAYQVEKAENVQIWIDALLDRFDIVRRLSEYGCKPKDLDEIARLSFTKGRMDNNPVALTEEDVRNLLTKIF